eukprot:TRINITY_DN16017_c0_g1_i1.p1 TRINITY_DN16017_c0_g1~~TRINITY_DN16017_c0_g1_i1.p1  ORF type:complete len:102 (+),score=25.05 TRINITY_DN16017_c0_g1_i1:217-522(+)
MKIIQPTMYWCSWPSGGYFSLHTDLLLEPGGGGDVHVHLGDGDLVLAQLLQGALVSSAYLSVLSPTLVKGKVLLGLVRNLDFLEGGVRLGGFFWKFKTFQV